MTDVAALLERSRRAHHEATRIKKADPAGARDHYHVAHELRADADTADPDHADPEWLKDALHPPVPGEPERRYHRMPGLTLEQVARRKHLELVAFFEAQFTEAPVVKAVPLTLDEIEAGIIAATAGVSGIKPTSEAVRKTIAFCALAAEHGHTIECPHGPNWSTCVVCQKAAQRPIPS